MGAQVEELQRIGITLVAAAGAAPSREIVPIFHRWIQTSALPDQLLIDVADYGHVPDGPGAVLVAHEGNLSLGTVDGQLLLTYVRKQPLAGDLPARLRAIAHTAVTAGRLLENEPTLATPLRFRGELFTVFANDRLRAPNTEAVRAALRPVIAELAGALYGGEYTLEDEGTPQERLQFRCRAAQPMSLDALAQRLG